MSSLAGLKKSYSILAKVPILAIFAYLGPPLKSIFYFLSVREKFQKIFGTFVRGGCEEQYVKFWAFYLFWPAGGGGLAVLQVDIFQNP